MKIPRHVQQMRGMVSAALVIAMLVLAMVAAVLVSMQVTALEGATGALHTTRAFYVADGAMQYGSGVRVLRQHLATSIPAAFQNVQFSSGNINMNSSSGNTNGDVSAVGTANIGSAVIVSGTVASGSALQIPPVDWDFYKAHANQVVNGNLDFSSGTYGDAVNGYIWYVTGNVKINGNTTINGTIVTEGNLTAQNPKANFTFQAVDKNVDADPAPEQMPALVIKGTWDFDNVNNLTVNGLVYVLGTVNLSHTDGLTLNGALVTDGNMNINNATDIHLTYDAAYVTDVPGFQSQGSTAVIVSRWEEVP